MALYKKSTENGLRTAEKTDPTTSEHARNIAHLISALAPNDKEISLQPSGTKTTKKCPILLEEMKKPLKNIHCGHVYSYDGALMLLQQKYRTDPSKARVKNLHELPHNLKERCPLSGCPAFFGPGTLKRDYATELSVRQKKLTSSQNDDIDALDITMTD